MPPRAKKLSERLRLNRSLWRATTELDVARHKRVVLGWGA